MKTLVLCLVVFSGLRLLAEPEPSVPAWNSDYAAALETATKTGKPLLLNFTGSDWCVWCHRLRDEVFQTPFFVNYANDALVLVEVDFPRKTSLPPGLKQQNEGLAQKFKVDSYPTVVLVSANGKELARLAYMRGGPKTFVRELKRGMNSVSLPATN